MSRSPPAAPEGSTATGSTSARSRARGAGGRLGSRALAPGQQQRRLAQAPALERALPQPVAPGRLPAAVASKRIAPGRGHSSAAVVVE